MPPSISKQISQHPQSPTTSTQQEFLNTLFDLCIAVAGAHPDSLRGMQMMVCVFIAVHTMISDPHYRYFWIIICFSSFKSLISLMKDTMIDGINI